MRPIRLRLSSFFHTLVCVLLVSPAAGARAQELAPIDASPLPQVVADRPSEEEPTAADEQAHKPDRMFGVLPNYSTVEGAHQVSPITTKQAFMMAAQNTFDPYVYPFVGVVAALGVGQTTIKFPRRYATAMTDNVIGNFMTTAVLPSLLHQDPRYFELGTGSFLHRAAYAASRSVITRSRSGARQFNVSEIGGNGLAAMFSNVYYPSADRSALGVATRWGSQVMWDTLSNELKEFWPDVRRKIHHQ
jgi:hypothetical protein